MTSNKIVFSLASFVVLLALAFVAPCALAGDFATELSVEDVSFADKSFPEFQHDNQVELSTNTIVYVKFDKIVNYRGGRTQDLDPGENFDDLKDSGVFTHHDVVIQIYNKNGVLSLTQTGANSVVIEPREPNRHDGQNFKITFDTYDPDPRVEDYNSVLVYIKQGGVTAADPAVAAADSKNAAASVAFNLVYSDGWRAATDGYNYPNNDNQNTVLVYKPAVYGISRLESDLRFNTGVIEPFKVKIRLSEQPRTFTTDHIDVTEGKATEIIRLPPVSPYILFGPFNDANFRFLPATGRGLIWVGTVYYEYLVTIEPKFENKNDIVIKVKAFEDLVKPTSKYNPNAPYKYTPPTSENEYVEGFDKLTVKVGKEAPKDKTAGIEVAIPNETRIPNGGYLVVTTSVADSGIVNSADGNNNKDEPKASQRKPAQLLYNVIAAGLPNLETFLANGGTIDLVAPNNLVISEIMWGSDASLPVNNTSQWIEIQNNSGASILTGENTHKLIFYGSNETPPAKTAAVATTATAAAVPAALPAGVADRVGTITDLGAYWSLAGKGQSGRTGQDEAAAELTALIPTQALISMYRVVDAKGAEMDGNTAAAWMQSTPPSVNFDAAKVGVRVASPGASRLITAAEAAATAAAAKAKSDAAAAAAAKAADTSVSMPKVGQIYISEVMFAGGGTLPQWIEISNGSRSEQVNLSGWTLTVENATADADVSVGSKAVFTIPEGTKINESSQSDTPSTILVVTEQGRNNIDDGAKGAGQILNLWTAQQTELILLGVTKRRYSLLSDMAFKVTLGPPTPKAVTPPATETPAAKATRLAAEAIATRDRTDATDVVGNLGTAGTATWALPMDEGARSSIIRRHVPVSIGPASPEAGEIMDSWVLASDTSFAQVTHIRASSYYGAQNDVGTPGFRAGGALPVELSQFRPARDEAGAAVITWSTQSELNNAGFFIKRGQQRDGEFQIINATMIAGAGTTSEKQFYTYEDTTAQPNVVYYYQIEDVSLDGNRQTLTRGIRLKGHVGAAGKATTTWGDLKTQE